MVSPILRVLEHVGGVHDDDDSNQETVDGATHRSSIQQKGTL